MLGARVASVEGKSGQSVRLRLIQGISEIVLEGTHLLVAAGRTPNTNGIGLEWAGVELTDAGYIKVNDRLETTAPNAPAAAGSTPNAERIASQIPGTTKAAQGEVGDSWLGEVSYS